MFAKFKSNQNEKLCIAITSKFLEHLGTDFRDKYPNEFNKCCASNEHIMELFRYSLCIALGLHSKVNMTDITDGCRHMAKMLESDFGRLLSKDIVYRQGVVQGCMHCIVMSRDRVGGTQ